MSETLGPTVIHNTDGNEIRISNDISITELLVAPNSSEISIVVVEINGTNQLVRNRSCDARYYVLEGMGKFDLEIKGEIKEFMVVKGDLIVIPKNTKFQDAGNMKMLAIYTPAFDPQQVETFN